MSGLWTAYPKLGHNTSMHEFFVKILILDDSDGINICFVSRLKIFETINIFGFTEKLKSGN